MMNLPILTWIQGWKPRKQREPATPAPLFATYFQKPHTQPAALQQSALAQRYIALLGPLTWAAFPERDLSRHWQPCPTPYAPFVAACLVKLDQQVVSMAHWHQWLLTQLDFMPLLGFPGPEALPTARHLTRMLRTLPNAGLQVLLDETVYLLRAEAEARHLPFGQVVALDTKHILAFVKENNPKAYVKERFNKTHQPVGDPDCKLGCKRRHNQRTIPKDTPPTPTANPVPGSTVAVGEFYWGYASGLVVTKVPGMGEVVLAELTQPFDRADVSYFFPLMAEVERRLGFRPPYGTLDAAYDAFYIYEYFHHPDQAGFAAVPLVEKGQRQMRQFTPEGLPLCEAQLPMPAKFTFTDRTRAILVHERARYVCPLCFPAVTGTPCPIQHPRWAEGGCTVDMPTSIGARLRYQLDRQSEAYKAIYKQRTATERLFSQAVALGIERPCLRNGQAITNLNTLIYILLNLRTLLRCRQKAETLTL